MMSSTEEDRISSLPDPLISHILSFLPTKDAAATSVLSKQWTPLWKSVLTLNIRDENFKGTDSFRQFVHSFVVMRDATLPIRRIRCTITPTMSKNLDPHDLNRFVQAAAHRGLEIFELYVSTSKKVPCLFGVLSCKTLVFLKLAYIQVPEVPNLVDLPLLKTLHLYMTKFTGSFVQFMNLLHGCPILEDLFTYKVKLPHIPSDFVQVEEFKGLSKLVRANIGLEENFEETFLFPWLYNVKFLGVVLTSNCFYRVPPTFHNLTHMELEFPFYSIHYYSQRLNWALVIQVLQHCPNLQNLIIHEDYPSCILPTEGDDWTEPETIPECLSSQLTKCSVTGFRGMECQLHFAEYILLNSKLLCTMVIETDGPLDSGEKLQLLKKLSSYPMSSGTCKLLFD